jgi:hypothetical protein
VGLDFKSIESAYIFLDQLVCKLSHTFFYSGRFGATESEAVIFYFGGKEASVEGGSAQAASVGQAVEP